MKSDPIAEQVRDYYEAQKLSPETVAKMESVFSALGYPGAVVRRRTFRDALLDFIFKPLRYRILPTVATALTVLVLINAVAWYHWYRTSEMVVSKNIAREIAMNHIKNLASEVQTSSIENLRVVMPALDFEPNSPELIKQLGLVVQGARYCSIQGHLAIQIKLRDASGQQHSIYQAPYLSPLQKLKPTMVNIDSVQILMWIEDGLFMGLAGPIKSPEV